MNKVIGIDISKSTFDVAFCMEGKWRHFQFENEALGFKMFIKKVSFDSHCIMEASGPYYLRLAMFLFEQGFKVSVVNPLVIRRFSQMRLIRAKTDKKDARIIAEYGMHESPRLWCKIDPVIIKMQQIITSLESIIKQKRMITNQIEAFTQSGIVDQQVKKSLTSLLRSFDRQQAKLETELNRYATDKYNSTIKRLESIPGIGRKAAIMLTILTENFTKFNNHKALIAYVGFSPRIYQSGTSVNGKGHICKMGKSQMRKILYMCTWTAKFKNKACVQMYERLKEKGKPERVIKIALANKLLKQAFSIATNENLYDEKYISKPCF